MMASFGQGVGAVDAVEGTAALGLDRHRRQSGEVGVQVEPPREIRCGAAAGGRQGRWRISLKVAIFDPGQAGKPRGNSPREKADNSFGKTSSPLPAIAA